MLQYLNHFLLSVTLMVATINATSSGQEASIELPGAAKRFAELEQGIKGQPEFWEMREQLAVRALRVAEQDLASKDAEAVLHWILGSIRTSPTTVQAAEYVLEHHATSELTTERLLLYAQDPREWTPNMFWTISHSELPDDKRWTVSLWHALHEKTLLELSDEIRQSSDNLERFEFQLGRELTQTLLEIDSSAMESRVVREFEKLAEQYGDKKVAGVTVNEFCSGSVFSLRHLRIGKTAVGLDGPLLDGNEMKLKDHKGKVVLVDFWATYCAPCIGELPKLKQLHSEMKNSEFSLIGVSADTNEGQLADFVKQHAINWPIVVDTEHKLLGKWQALSLPTYYVLDREHVVKYRGGDGSQAARVVRDLLGGNGLQVNLQQMHAQMLESLDKNGNRRLELEELPDGARDAWKAADVDRDGSISVVEWEKFSEGKITSEKVEPNIPSSR